MEALIDEPEDVEACIREGRRPREHGPYRVRIGDADFAFNAYRIDDPIPTGRQLLESAGARPTEVHLIFQMLRDGRTAHRKARGDRADGNGSRAHDLQDVAPRWISECDES